MKADAEAQILSNTEFLLQGWEREWRATGKSLPLMLTVARCAMQEKPIPTWAAEAFDAAVKSVERMDRVSWDDAFGRPHLRSKVRSLRTERDLGVRVWFRVHQWKNKRPRLSMDKIRQEVAKESVERFGKALSGATVKRYFEKLELLRKSAEK